ncbi:hypothetical protein GCM10010260_53120 [Streptomyces filipinensis]|uniref:Uncharacterized protein n=1 Tax=Streptomyces filipinensis TaxID=66887 RepID=A0A918IEP8_9ACTN|nr:hypothetical protein GCM10010260_53120 [Streptomyces filipinensis]
MPGSFGAQCGPPSPRGPASAAGTVSAASAAPHATPTATSLPLRPLRRVLPKRLMAGEASPPGRYRPEADRPPSRAKTPGVPPCMKAVTEVTRFTCARIGRIRRLFQCRVAHTRA